MRLSDIEKMIKINMDNSILSYILENEELFFEIGYKVLQSQEKNGFIKCVRISHNGKIKLVYNISKYKTLESVIKQLTSKDFMIIVSKLFFTLNEVKNNGFMQYENIDLHFNKIFIDTDNLNTYLIYLPINIQSDFDSVLKYEKELKENILQVISNNINLQSVAVEKLYKDINSKKFTIRELMENIKGYIETDAEQPESSIINSIGVMDKQNQIKWQNGSLPQSEKTDEANPELYRPDDSEDTKANKGNIKNVISGFLPFGKRKERSTGHAARSFVFCGVNTQEPVEFAINKSEFVIGNNIEGAVDGSIRFSKAISRVHCKIVLTDNQLFICDMGSRNGTYVNNKRLQQGKQVQINAGDKIHLANVEFTIKST